MQWLLELFSLFLDKWVLGKPPALHVLMARCLFQAHLHGCSLDPSTPLGVFREQTGAREVPDLTKAQEFASFGASTKRPRVCSRGWVCPSCAWSNLWSDRYDFDAKVFNRMQVSCSNYSHEIMIYSTGYLFWERCLSVFSGLLGTVCSFCLLCLSAFPGCYIHLTLFSEPH